MKALILAGGRGKRLGKTSEGINKCMLNIFGKPLLEYSIESAAMLGEIDEIIIVVGYRAEDIVNYYGNTFKNKRIKYVIQWEQGGLVDAIDWARDAIGKDDFMLMLGDEFMLKPRHKEMINKFKEESLFGVCGIVEVGNAEFIRKTYTLLTSPEGKIRRLVEKPQKPFNNLMGTGNCIFRNEIFSYISKTPINPNRQEKELPDLIQCAIEDNNIINSFVICDRYININSPVELEEIESYFSHI